MPKLKSHRGAKKRFKVTKTGKILHAKSNRRHILTSKSSKRKRHSRKMAVVHPGDVEHLRHMMPYD